MNRRDMIARALAWANHLAQHPSEDISIGARNGNVLSPDEHWRRMEEECDREDAHRAKWQIKDADGKLILVPDECRSHKQWLARADNVIAALPHHATIDDETLVAMACAWFQDGQGDLGIDEHWRMSEMPESIRRYWQPHAARARRVRETKVNRTALEQSTKEALAKLGADVEVKNIDIVLSDDEMARAPKPQSHWRSRAQAFIGHQIGQSLVSNKVAV